MYHLLQWSRLDVLIPLFFRPSPCHEETSVNISSNAKYIQESLGQTAPAMIPVDKSHSALMAAFIGVASCILHIACSHHVSHCASSSVTYSRTNTCVSIYVFIYIFTYNMHTCTYAHCRWKGVLLWMNVRDGCLSSSHWRNNLLPQGK